MEPMYKIEMKTSEIFKTFVLLICASIFLAA